MGTDNPLQIQEVCFGRMKVDDEEHRKDLKVVDGKVKGGWWRGKGHLLTAADIPDILENGPEVLVVGAGIPGRMQIDESLKKDLAAQDISLVVLSTDKAAAKFNDLVFRGIRADAAFHLTC